MDRQIELLIERAENGEAWAQNEWFRLASEQGNRDAQYALGLAFEHGWGRDQDYKEAAKWYRLAAEKGHKEAKELLEEINKK